ncbi:hypothetical protein D1AOALGA4SA_12340 [Olavius algarvensis Delta 1 endosymbiont]|nr:hypothetical protein D1AOALGA4SA_12340 [Olavius algarvensis Delta 1 endosymbiont]
MRPPLFGDHIQKRHKNYAQHILINPPNDQFCSNLLSTQNRSPFIL